jgi:hypothetical protein
MPGIISTIEVKANSKTKQCSVKNHFYKKFNSNIMLIYCNMAYQFVKSHLKIELIHGT